MNSTEMALLLATAMTLASPEAEAETVPVIAGQPRRPVPPHRRPLPMREVSVTIRSANPSMGNAWILTPSQRPNLHGHWFVPGSRVHIFASPAPGFVFSHWTFHNLSSGNVTVSRTGNTVFIVHGPTAITAHFSPLRPPPRPPVPRPPVRPRPPVHPPRPPVRPRPPAHPPRPPVQAVPPIHVFPPSHPPVRPVPPIGIVPVSSQEPTASEDEMV